MLPAPTLDQLNIVVRDMDAAVAFYTALGLQVQPSDDAYAQHHRNLTRDGSVSIDLDSEAFARQWSSGWPARPAPARGVVIGFRLPTREAVDQLFDQVIAAGYTGQQVPYDAFWGSRYAIVEDPDGHAIGLMSPRDDAYRGAPPPPPDA